MFLVIEGIDGAGCETQAKMVFQALKNHRVPSEALNEQRESKDEVEERKKQHDQKENVFLVKYPHYDDAVGKMIQQFLYENKDLNPQQQFLLYSLQFINDSKKINDDSKKGTVIADRYFTSTLCFQTLEGINLNTAIKFAEDFKIVKPNMVFYLDVNPDTAIKRKYGENKEKNRREKDFEFIKKTHKQYDKLVNNQVWTKWVRINGERGVEEITNDIYNEITNYK